MSAALHMPSTSVSFAHDQQLVSSLLEDLQTEQTALIAADLASIEQGLEQRSALLQSIASAAQERYAQLGLAGFSANESGMQAWLRAQANPQLTAAWEQFQQQLAEAKELNRINGLLIAKHFQQNQERLDSLHGSRATPQMYGRNGQSQSLGTLRGGFAV